LVALNIRRYIWFDIRINGITIPTGVIITVINPLPRKIVRSAVAAKLQQGFSDFGHFKTRSVDARLILDAIITDNSTPSEDAEQYDHDQQFEQGEAGFMLRSRMPAGFHAWVWVPTEDRGNQIKDKQ
jgi:hypothetical protein